MGAVQVVEQLLLRLTPAGAACVLAALRQDDLVWQGIIQLDLAEKVAAGPQDGLEQWSPANFALAALDSGLSALDLRAVSTLTLPDDQLQYALTTLSGLKTAGKVTSSLIGAGLVALALRERFRLAHHWPAVFDLSGLDETAALSSLASIWQAGILCLYPFLPDPAEMLRAVIARLPAGLGVEWAVHCLLANPASEENQRQRMLPLLVSLSPENQVEWLKCLQSAARPDLAASLARSLLDVQPPAFAGLLEPLSLHEINAPAYTERQLRLQQAAVVYLLAGDSAQAASLLSFASQIASHTLAFCQVRQAAVGSLPLDWQPGLIQAALRSPAVQADLDFSAPGPLWDVALLELPGEETLHPLLALHKARLLVEQGNLLNGQEIARNAACRLVALCQDQQLPHSPVSWDPVETLHEFVRLDLLGEASRVADAFLAIRPADVRLLAAAGRIYEQCGELDRAVETALICSSLAPADTAYLRRLAECYETTLNWTQALAVREKWLALLPNPSVEDCLNLAAAALKAGNVLRAREICAQVLSDDPDHGSAHALMGQVCLSEGDLAAAVNHLSQATLLAPEQPRSWLLLAEVLRSHGQPGQSLETLRAAVMAVPNSAQLHFALGSACLEDGLPSEALPALRDASRLDPDSPDIAAVYAGVLHDLGHGSDARHLLQQARRRWPSHARLAAVDGRTLIEAGDLESALPALEIALKSPHPEPIWYLWYARALLLDNHRGIPGTALDEVRLQQAYQALQKAAALLGENFEAQVLMAEVLRALKNVDQAYDLYQSLVDRPEAAASEWRCRVQTGFGQVALALGQVETAVAALREAAQARPEDSNAQQLLAEAYWKANLYPESAQTARQALSLAPDHLDTLLWYVDLMTRLGLETETLPALIAVTQLEPRRPEHWNRLARLQHHCGDDTAARLSLASLLEIGDLSTADLQQAASTYVLMGDLLDALACLERAAAALPLISAELLFEMSALHKQLNQAEAALDVLQRAIIAEPDQLALHILESDLLVSLGRGEAARACLEKALLLQQKLSRQASVVPPSLTQSVISSGDWLETALSPAAIHTRLVALLYACGDLPACLDYAEKGLVLEPDSLPLRVLAVQAARGILASSRAQNLLQAAPHVPAGQQDRWSQALAALRAETALEAGEVVQAAGYIETGVSEIPDESHLLAVQARLLAHMGDSTGAQQALASAGECLPELAGAPILPNPESNLWCAYQGSAPLSFAEAALDLEQWQTALEGFKDYAAAHPTEPRAHLRYARALVVSAERQQLCSALRSLSHAPGPSALSAENQAACEEAINAAGPSSSPDVSVWAARARAVFQPGLQHAPALAKLPPSAEHAAALIAVLRVSKNAGNAVRIVHHYPESPELLVQIALCYREIDPAQGVAAAQKAVQDAPHQPLNHAALASLAEASGDLSIAVEALENAIAAWPDEPEWHVWAAGLCLQTGQDTLALAHQEKAHALCPARLDYALSLAQLHLDHGNASRAIDILLEASCAMPEEKMVWITLAHAYLFSGSPEIALDCADRASGLDPLDPAPLLLGGEISLQLGKPDLALEHARAAQSIAPAQPEVVLFHSRALVQKGQLSDALAVLEKAVPRMPGSQSVLVERASLVRRLHGAAAALPLWIELSQLYPQDPAILTLLAQTEADCGDLKSAERTAYAAYHLDPDRPQVNLLLGRLQYLAGQLDQAIHFLSEAIRLSHGDIDAYLDLGQAYLERREDAQALHTYQQAIKVAPRDHRPYYHAALIMRDNKDYLSAEAMLRRAAELAPDDLNIRRQLGAVVALNLVHNSQEVNSLR